MIRMLPRLTWGEQLGCEPDGDWKGIYVRLAWFGRAIEIVLTKREIVA